MIFFKRWPILIQEKQAPPALAGETPKHRGEIMALFEGWKGNILGGLAIGIGASVVAPVVIPVLATVVKPLTKAAIKGGFLLYDKGRETLAEAQEVIEDLVAEAKAEMEEAQEAPSPEAVSGPAADSQEG